MLVIVSRQTAYETIVHAYDQYALIVRSTCAGCSRSHLGHAQSLALSCRDRVAKKPLLYAQVDANWSSDRIHSLSHPAVSRECRLRSDSSLPAFICVRHRYAIVDRKLNQDTGVWHRRKSQDGALLATRLQQEGQNHRRGSSERVVDLLRDAVKVG